ncbi:UNVERIFIED_CONTAM: hypothetical protein FKN15_029001 [Acipenser sinensis]
MHLTVCNDLPVHRNTQGAKTSRDRPDAKAHTAPKDHSTTEKEKTSRRKSVKEEDKEIKKRQVWSGRRTPAEREENKTQPGATTSSLTPIKEEWTPESFLLLMKILQIDIPEASDKSLLQGQWQNNTSNTGRGFILSPAFRSTLVSTPVMHTGPVTRSWSRLTKGFGMFATNKYDELECLKWFHETAKENKAFGGGAAGYICGNRVQYGFLTGNVDVFAEFNQDRPRETQCDKLLIECKGTTGDMVWNFFTKT